MTKELSHRHGLERRNVGIKNMDLRIIHFLIYSRRVLSRLVVLGSMLVATGSFKARDKVVSAKFPKFAANRTRGQQRRRRGAGGHAMATDTPASEKDMWPRR